MALAALATIVVSATAVAALAREAPTQRSATRPARNRGDVVQDRQLVPVLDERWSMLLMTGR